MPQTLTGWILFAATILAGAGGGYLSARVITTVRDSGVIPRRDAAAVVGFVALLMASALLLWFVEGR
ncbi:hypothetical protein ACLBXJ_26875 [Methylobacterium mesophilicum]